MRISTLNHLANGATELGVVHASIEGANERSYDECLHELKERAAALGANALIGIRLTQSQGQWNQRTSLIATAVKE